ncbi:MAG: hypothetical protein QM811_02545 [Pirellulales bacterium]
MIDYATPPDRFEANVRPFVAQFVLLGVVGFVCLTMAIAQWTGMVGDTSDSTSSRSIPTQLFFGVALLSLALPAGCNLLARRTASISCYREGIEFNLIGAVSLTGDALTRGIYRQWCPWLSFQGWRRRTARLEWSQFQTVSLFARSGASDLRRAWVS